MSNRSSSQKETTNSCIGCNSNHLNQSKINSKFDHDNDDYYQAQINKFVLSKEKALEFDLEDLDDEIYESNLSKNSKNSNQHNAITKTTNENEHSFFLENNNNSNLVVYETNRPGDSFFMHELNNFLNDKQYMDNI